MKRILKNNVREVSDEFVPGVAGGDGLRGGGGEARRIRGDADPAKIEPVGVEADSQSGIGLRHAAVVYFASGDEEIHAEVIELKVAGLAE